MYGPTRSMSGELAEGMTDGTYKKVINGRGGFVETTTEANREHLYDIWYGFHEIQTKELPDGTCRATPGYVPTAPALGPI